MSRKAFDGQALQSIDCHVVDSLTCSGTTTLSYIVEVNDLVLVKGDNANKIEDTYSLNDVVHETI